MFMSLGKVFYLALKTNATAAVIAVFMDGGPPGSLLISLSGLI